MIKTEIEWSCELCGYDRNAQEIDCCDICGFVDQQDMSIKEYGNLLNIKDKETV